MFPGYPEMLWVPHPWSVKSQVKWGLEQLDLIENNPVLSRVFETRWSLRYLQTSTFLWFYDLWYRCVDERFSFQINSLYFSYFHSWFSLEVKANKHPSSLSVFPFAKATPALIFIVCAQTQMTCPLGKVS